MQMSELKIVLEELVAQIHNILGDNLERIVLYGSYARGDNEEDSDVDIMVLTNLSSEENRKYDRELNKIFSRLGLEHDILLSMYLKDKATYEYWFPVLPFYQNTEKDGIVLYQAVK